MLVSEDNGPYESISDGVRALSDAKVEEDRLGSYLLSTGAHGVPAHLVEYYAYFVHLQSERKEFNIVKYMERKNIVSNSFHQFKNNEMEHISIIGLGLKKFKSQKNLQSAYNEI